MARRPKTSSHNYLRKLEALADRLDKYGPSISNVEILHDEWCDFHLDLFCNCDPSINVVNCEIVTPKN